MKKLSQYSIIFRRMHPGGMIDLHEAGTASKRLALIGPIERGITPRRLANAPSCRQ